MKNIKWILIFSVVCLLCFWGWKKINNTPAQNSVAQIKQGSDLIYSIDLSAVETPYEFDIKYDSGVNRVRVENGKIAVVSANCPDQVCVKKGYISNTAVPIVCLPHKLSITLTDGIAADGVDAVAGGN